MESRLKKIIPLLLATFLFTACTSSTKHGECIGALSTPDPTLRYEYDLGNIILAVIFSETIVVPLIVVFDDLKCPVGEKVQK